MNSKILIAALLSVSAMSVQAQRLVATSQVVDCGKTGYRVPATATFELKNKSSRRLIIDGVKTDCGCTTLSMPDKELASGETCIVKLTYDAQLLGHYEKKAVVNFRTRQSTSEPPLTLTMKGVVLPEVKDYSKTYPYSMGELLADKNVLEFDDVNRGDNPQIEINILNNGSKPMVPNVQHLPSYLDATITPEQLLPGRAGKVVLKLNSSLIHDFGLTQTSIYLASYLGEKVSPENEVPVSVVLLPDLKGFEGGNRQYAPKMELSSATVDLGLIDGKNRKKSEIIITNNGRTTLNISSLQMFTEGLRLTLDKRKLEAHEQTRLRVVGDLNLLKKARSKPRILMITNDPDRPKVVINVNVH